MPGPRRTPLGLELARTAKAVSAAFDRALTEAGGSRPEWLVLLTVKTHPDVSQREIADAVGIRGATLTHHLDRLEADGLLTRRRDPGNRRSHVVELTDRGEEKFLSLREAAVAHDDRLRAGLGAADEAVLHDVLSRLRGNVAAEGA